tara:strand:- start:42 stop:287 length:246 start_codon:yes stop_codon:yes gene_type:complete
MKIRYFAWIKDITDKDFEVIKKDFPKNISELKIKLINLHPQLEKYIVQELFRYAINMEYISTNEKLTATDEIAIFPPVSGG